MHINKEIKLPEKIERAMQAFGQLSGVGEKSAQRFVMEVIGWEETKIQKIGGALLDLIQIKRCQDCGFFCEEELCFICSDEKRKNEKTLCVVSNPIEYMAIEKTGHFRGVFHILGGVLNPMKKVLAKDLRLNSLFYRVKQLEIESLMLALNATLEGDVTCAYIKEKLPEHIRVERIGFGIPMGGHLEYLDPQTIAKGLENRTVF